MYILIANYLYDTDIGYMVKNMTVVQLDGLRQKKIDQRDGSHAAVRLK